MEALRTHVAGVDVHKEILAITVLIGKHEESQKPRSLNARRLRMISWPVD